MNTVKSLNTHMNSLRELLTNLKGQLLSRFTSNSTSTNTDQTIKDATLSTETAAPVATETESK